MEEPVTIIDREVLKVLSVDTRMNILKELGNGDRTPSDLSKVLNKSNATIVEHLEVLRKSGLVKKIEQPGKKWIFYTLTDRGYGIISSKSRRLVIILVTSVLALVGGLVTFGQYSTQFGFYRSMAGIPATEAGKGVPTVIQEPTLLYVSIILFVIAGLGFTFYTYKKIKLNKERQ